METEETDILPSGLHAKSCKKFRNRQKETRLKNECENGRVKYYCKECGCSQFCEHNRKKNCKDCKGSQICEHNKHKSACKKCNFELYLINLQKVQIYIMKKMKLKWLGTIFIQIISNLYQVLI